MLRRIVNAKVGRYSFPTDEGLRRTLVVSEVEDPRARRTTVTQLALIGAGVRPEEADTRSITVSVEVDILARHPDELGLIVLGPEVANEG